MKVFFKIRLTNLEWTEREKEELLNSLAQLIQKF